MNLQEECLVRFKEKYKGWSYQRIAEKTGLNVTRVFRVFNGYEMKVSEWSIFEEAIRGDDLNHHERIKDLTNKCLKSLKQRTLTDLEFFLKQCLVLNQIKRSL